MNDELNGKFIVISPQNIAEIMERAIDTLSHRKKYTLCKKCDVYASPEDHTCDLSTVAEDKRLRGA